MKKTLGNLSEPTSFDQPIDIDGENPDWLKQSLRTMYQIRRAEERIGDKVTDGDIKCPCHLGIGQEAVAVGVAANLTPNDRTFGGHRSHSHYLSQGAPLYGLFAEVLGKQDGCSGGMGGSMHLTSRAHGFAASVPIVGGTIGFAVGAALAAQKDGKNAIAVAYFGDGATEEGTLHECLNFAAIFKLPVLFVCENNLFSSHLHISLRQPADSTARFAEAHMIKNEVIDGNDVVLIRKTAAKLIENIRAGKGPGYLEAVTYRWRGHVGPREDIDVGVKRKDDLNLWKAKDPIRRLAESMKTKQWLNPEGEQKIYRQVDEEVESTWAQAEAAAYPPVSTLTEHTYKGADLS